MMVLLEVLSEDEYEVLHAMLRCAIAKNRKIQTDLEDFIDAMHDDYPYMERVALSKSHGYGEAEWDAISAYERALYRIGDASSAHYNMRRDLLDLL